VIRIFGYIWLLIRIQVLLTAVKLFTCRFQVYRTETEKVTNNVIQRFLPGRLLETNVEFSNRGNLL
jgi:hypothetical protein